MVALGFGKDIRSSRKQGIYSAMEIESVEAVSGASSLE